MRLWVIWNASIGKKAPTELEEAVLWESAEALSKENWRQHSLTLGATLTVKPAGVNLKPKKQEFQLQMFRSFFSKSRMLQLMIGYSIYIFLVFAGFGAADADAVEAPLTLKQTIENALQANLELKSTVEETRAAEFLKKKQQTEFLPTLSANYQYVHHDEERQALGIGVVRPEDEYTFAAKFSQPIFTGFALTNQYKIAELSLDAAKINQRLRRQDIILEAKQSYFLLLKAQKLMKIAEDTVKQIDAQKEVAKHFYEVGMTPLNDLLQSQVELANANQELIAARNSLENAESNFNLLLRKPIDTRVQIKDILEYRAFKNDLAYCIEQAEKNRAEIIIAKLQVDRGKKELELARKNYYPTVALEGTYYKQGVDWYVNGGAGISAPDGWDLSAMASWDFWQWGKTNYGVGEKRSRLSQAQLQQTRLIDNIHLEVKKAFLRTLEAEKAILTIEKAIEQAKENFRINQERYKEQVGTATDVLIAQTLLSRTMTNYYSALYEFKIAKATLYRAIGKEVIE